MKPLLDIAKEKLESLQHYSPDEKYSILGQLIYHLVLSQESAGDGTDFELLAISLSRLSEGTVHNFLFPCDDFGETEEWITDLLREATTKEEIYEVMIDILLDGALIEWSEPESQ